jgi:hypothetical protein
MDDRGHVYGMNAKTWEERRQELKQLGKDGGDLLKRR